MFYCMFYFTCDRSFTGYARFRVTDTNTSLLLLLMYSYMVLLRRKTRCFIKMRNNTLWATAYCLPRTPAVRHQTINRPYTDHTRSSHTRRNLQRARARPTYSTCLKSTSPAKYDYRQVMPCHAGRQDPTVRWLTAEESSNCRIMQ